MPLSSDAEHSTRPTLPVTIIHRMPLIDEDDTVPCYSPVSECSFPYPDSNSESIYDDSEDDKRRALEMDMDSRAIYLLDPEFNELITHAFNS